MKQADKRFVCRGFIVTVLLLLAQGLSAAQDKSEWTELTTESKDFSIELPKGYLIDKHEKQMTIFAHAPSAVIKIETEKVSKPKDQVRERYYPKDGRSSTEKVEIGDFLVWKMDVVSNGVYSTIVRAGSSNAYYAITTSSDSKDNPAIARFLASIRFNGKQMSGFSGSAADEPQVSDILGNLGTSPEIILALSREIRSSPAPTFGTVKEKVTTDLAGYSRGLIIVRRPKPPYTDDARMNHKQGTIKAKVDFLADGRIGAIVVEPFLDRGLADMVGQAILRIKFVPAQRDGKSVDVTRVMEYTFGIY